MLLMELSSRDMLAVNRGEATRALEDLVSRDVCPRVVDAEKKMLTPVDENSELIPWTQLQRKETGVLLAARTDLALFRDQEGNMVLDRRPGIDRQLGMSIVLSPQFLQSGPGDMTVLAEDLMVSCGDRAASMRSVFAHEKELSIVLCLTKSMPKSKDLWVSEMVGWYGYHQTFHNVRLAEPLFGGDLECIAHEAGHSWESEVVSPEEKDEEMSARNFIFYSSHAKRVIRKGDRDVIRGVQAMSDSERRANLAGRIIRSKLRAEGFSPPLADDEDIRRKREEHYLEEYDVARAWFIINYSNHHGLDPTMLFAARRNRTINGVQEMRKNLAFSRQMSDSLEPIVTEIQREITPDIERGYSATTRTKEWRDKNGDFVLTIHPDEDDRLVSGSVRMLKKPGGAEEFSWSPFWGVSVKTTDRRIAVVPGETDEAIAQNRRELRYFASKMRVALGQAFLKRDL